MYLPNLKSVALPVHEIIAIEVRDVNKDSSLKAKARTKD